MNDLLPDDLVQTALRYYESCGSPLALSCAIKLKNGLWDELADVSPKPELYLSAGEYFKDAAAAAFLKKLSILPTTHDRRANALKTWWDGEFACKKTNIRLDPFLDHAVSRDMAPGLSSFGRLERQFKLRSQENGRIADFFNDVKRILNGWLGPVPPDLLEGRFGPGATLAATGRMTTVPDKMSLNPTCTQGAIWLLPQWAGTLWSRAISNRLGKIEFVHGNRFTTVPKTAKTDRSIAIEPDINVFYQLAVGRALRGRLKRSTGWDLDKAAMIHRQVARESSISREFATLDLSNASDTLSLSLVQLLLPPRWFELLSFLRSPKSQIDGKWIVLEKFSSMGNGFTFELETIIFAALCCAVSRQAGHKGRLGLDVFVFGDDIIVKDDIQASLKSVLQFCGFTLNADKSFSGASPFRESCGGDYFLGSNVRPFYLKHGLSEIPELIACANGIRAVGEKAAVMGIPFPGRPRLFVLDHLPKKVRECRGPSDLGDIVIHDEPETWSTKTRFSIRYIKTYLPTPRFNKKWDWFSGDVQLASATYGVKSPNRKGWTWAQDGGVTPRNVLLSYKVSWTPYS